MWFITIIVLALAAFLVIKAVKAQSVRKTTGEADSSPHAGLQGNLKRDSSLENATERKSAANDSAQPDSNPEGVRPDDLQDSTAVPAVAAANQQDELREIREMIKILNLAETDSGRLGINAEQFNALRAEESADAATIPAAEVQADIADRLRRMLA